MILALGMLFVEGLIGSYQDRVAIANHF